MVYQCCVTECPNTSAMMKKSNWSLSFYNFPNANVFAPWKAEKRKLWVDAVKHYTQYGDDWEPSASTKICNAHFIGRSKSEHPEHPSYIPTVFPGTTSSQIKLLTEKLQMFQKNILKQQGNINISVSKSKKPRTKTHYPRKDRVPKRNCRDKMSQTNLSQRNETRASFFFCQVEKINEKISCAHVQINSDVKQTTEKSTLAHLPPTRGRDVGCDTVTEDQLKDLCEGFHGFESIKTDKQLSDFTGISFDTFRDILNQLPNARATKLTRENKLLAFLMKIRQGLTFSALGVLFGISRSSIHRNFLQTLDKLESQLEIDWSERRLNRTHVIVGIETIDTELPTSQESPTTSKQKFIIGISPEDKPQIVFISNCYNFHESVSSIILLSGMLDHIRPGNVVFSNHSTLRAEVEQCGGVFEIGQSQIYETVIGRLKDFLILEKIPGTLVPYVDNILPVVGGLVNLEMARSDSGIG